MSKMNFKLSQEEVYTSGGPALLISPPRRDDGEILWEMDIACKIYSRKMSTNKTRASLS